MHRRYCPLLLLALGCFPSCGIAEALPDSSSNNSSDPNNNNYDGFGSDAALVPFALQLEAQFLATVNRIRQTRCPALADYARARTTHALPLLFNAEGAASLVQFEFCLLASTAPASKFYRTNASIFAQGNTESERGHREQGFFNLTDTILPDPCDDAHHLAITFWAVNRHNSHGDNRTHHRRTWKARAHPHMMARLISSALVPSASTVGPFHATAPPGGRRLLQTNNNNNASDQYVSVVDNITLPADYLASDTYAGHPACKAFVPLDQGSTSGCAVFSFAVTMSSRMCLLNGYAARFSSIDNVVLSPRQIGDCTAPNWYTDGAGFDLTWASTLPPKVVPDWCAPFVGLVRNNCTSNICTGSIRYGGLPGSAIFVTSLPLMQAELLKNGPGSVSICVVGPFSSYSSGVFDHPWNASESSAYHMITIIGWGVSDTTGIPYWHIQNSWGRGWGEGGFARIRRGVNVMGIENNGLYVMRPVSSAHVCAHAPPCALGSRTMLDCSCVCDPRSFLTGAQCEVCPRDTCLNGGRILDPTCTTCLCPKGRYGRRCEFGIEFSYTNSTPGHTWAACASTSLAFNFTFDAAATSLAIGTARPSGGSLLAFVLPANINSGLHFVAQRSFCGALSPTQFCPASNGTLQITLPSTPAVYRVYLMRAVPLSGGATGYYVPSNSYNTFFGEYTVLAPANATYCAAAPLTWGRAYDPIDAYLQTALSRALVGEARLRAAQPAMDALRSRWAVSDAMPPRISIQAAWRANLSSAPTSPCERAAQADLITSVDNVLYLWSGAVGAHTPYRLCATLTPLFTDFAKKLRLYALPGNFIYGAGALGPTAINAAWQGKSDDTGKCVNFQISGGVDANQRYTIELYNTVSGRTVATSVWFRLKRIELSCAPAYHSNTYVYFTVRYRYVGIHAVPMLWDSITFSDRFGAVVDTFYTYCACRTPPGPTSIAAAPQNGATITIQAQKVPGGVVNTANPTRAPYTARFNRANVASVVLASATPSLIWTSYGL